MPSDTLGSAGSYVNSMFVSGNDIYAAGRHLLQPAYWKNDNLVLLPYNGDFADATGIAVLNGDVYISGYDNFRSRTGYSTRIPCFGLDPDLAVLPSFGVFTGGYEVTKEIDREIFVVAGEKMIKV